jgi:subtilisin family serine protease
VLDDGNASRPEFLYPDVLKRIMAYLHETKGRYKFVNISLGPDLAVDDDDVTAWTASLDEFFAENPAVVTVAAGNEGEGNRASGDHRVQPPADAVNLLSVGACDSQGSTWKAASYSSRGPGRSPGVVKPDGVVFGGRPEEPFIVLASAKTPHGRGVFGTSYAAPYALRGAVGCGIQLGDSVSPLGIRALLIHRAEAGGHDRVDVGWGRFDTDPGRLITCEDSEAIVMYQGKLPLGQHLRAQLPVPPGIKGRLSISATLVVAPEVDPEHPGAYTRAGFEIVFRPSVRTLRQYQDGTVSKQPKSKRMFGERVYHAEYELRRDAHKWEPCRREATSVQAEKLDRPMFDVYYHHRLAGAAAAKPRPISYALVVGLRAPKVADLYRRVVLEFQNILVPIQPKVEIPISARVSR